MDREPFSERSLNGFAPLKVPKHSRENRNTQKLLNNVDIFVQQSMIAVGASADPVRLGLSDGVKHGDD